MTMIIFLRDSIIPVRCGLYAHEFDAPQPVRLTIEARLTESASAVPSWHDPNQSVDYMWMKQKAEELGTSQHTPMLEEFARLLADTILSQPTIDSVRITLEKTAVLETGSVGVTWEKRR